jgi:ADP-heptose:LPS heptosyltransferase
MIDEQWRAVRNVLLIRLDNLGDMLLMTPAFHAIRMALPQARLTLLASPVGAQVGLLNPDIDEVIPYQAPWVDPWRKLPHNSTREQQMIARLKAGHFDGAIIFTSFRQSALPAAYMCYLADIPLRAAASIDGAGSLLTTRHKHPEHIMHEVERGLDLVAALGIEATELQLVLDVPDEAQAKVAALIAHSGVRGHPLIVVHPGCSMPARTYPWEMYAEAIPLLIEQTGAAVVITGDEGERELVERINERIKQPYRENVLPMAGMLPFAQFCALIRLADLVITNNTGPMHMAAAVKTSVVVLFALTNPPEQWRPWQVPQRLLYHEVPCRICYSRVCPYHHECLCLVSPQSIVNAAKDLLACSSSSVASEAEELSGGNGGKGLEALQGGHL